MPPKFKYKREDIIEAAFNLTKKCGISTVTARNLAAELGASTKPIFGFFLNMEEVHREVFDCASRLYHQYLQEDMNDGIYPPYKASGMAYIRFAKEEPELFKWLFMRDRANEGIDESKDEIRPQLDMIKKNLGLSEEDATLFHMEMWIYVHGIATMCATKYLQWNMEFVSNILSDAYEGLKNRFLKETGHEGN